MDVNSKIYLSNVKFNKSLLHVTDDPNFFDKVMKSGQSYSDYTYIRKDKEVFIEAQADDINKYNYLVFQNTDYNSKYIGCFITGIEYVNDNTTKLKIETDDFHTYWNDVTPQICFIERNHIFKENDIKGTQYIEENLETGDYKLQNKEVNLFEPRMAIAVMVNATIKDDPNILDKFTGAFEMVRVGWYETLSNSTKIYIFSNDSTSAFNDFIQKYNEYGGENYILAIYMIPEDFIDKDFNTLIDEGSELPNTRVKKIDRLLQFQSDDIDGYVPKNNKLFCYPYNFCRLQNGCGQQKIVKFEDQKYVGNAHGAIVMRSIATISQPNVCVKSYVVSTDFEDKDNYITLSGFPMLAWNSNSYASWLANNSGNIAATLGGLAISIGAGAATGGASTIAGLASVGTSTSSLSLMGGFLDKQKDISKSNGSISGVGVDAVNGGLTITAGRYSIKNEMAKKIDDFFTMYGYKINSMGYPNFRSRAIFNYVKTNGFNMIGIIPESAKEKISSLFDRGVTIWHNYDTMYRYDLKNE